MFYEEKLIDGVLYSRTSPRAEFEIARTARADPIERLCGMPASERLLVMKWFCRGCGELIPHGGCHCENDE